MQLKVEIQLFLNKCNICILPKRTDSFLSLAKHSILLNSQLSSAIDQLLKKLETKFTGEEILSSEFRHPCLQIKTILGRMLPFVKQF